MPFTPDTRAASSACSPGTAQRSAAKMGVILCFLGELADELKTTAAQFTEEHATQLEAGAMPQ